MTTEAPSVRTLADRPGASDTRSYPAGPALGCAVPRNAGSESNRLIQALPERERAQIEERLSPAFLKARTVLFEPRQPVGAVHFPVDGVVSLVTPFDGGAVVEVATVGNEGLVGVPAVPGGRLAVRAVCPVAGRALTMEAGAFVESLRQLPALATMVERYVQALFGQIAQAVACNRLHSNEERLGRWLLMGHDRVGRDSIHISEQSLAQLLGSRRATVTRTMEIFRAAGLVRYRGGCVTVLDRAGLEAIACECYREVRMAFDALDGWTATASRPGSRHHMPPTRARLGTPPPAPAPLTPSSGGPARINVSGPPGQSARRPNVGMGAVPDRSGLRSRQATPAD